MSVFYNLNKDGYTSQLDDIFVPKEFFTLGELLCWGENSSGQLGDGTTNSSNTPQTTFYQFGDFKKVDSGINFAAGLTMQGELYVWGSNSNGVFGDGSSSNTSNPYPTLVPGHLWYDFACGSTHIAAIKEDGQLYEWGIYAPSSQSFLPLAQSLTNGSYGPYILNDYSARKVWASSQRTFILTTGDGSGSDGHIYSRGFSPNREIGRISNKNDFGHLIETSNNSLSVIEKNLLRYPKDFSAGASSTGIINQYGQLYWMGNNDGPNGNGNSFITGSGATAPSLIGNDTNWKRCSAGYFYQAAIKDDGTLWTWGYNNEGQLGLGNTIDYDTPQQVGSEINWKYVSCGLYSTLAIKTDGTLWGWGKNTNDLLGAYSQSGTPPTKILEPTQIGTLKTWGSIATSQESYYGIVYDKMIYH